jgi:hypothetical protein
MHGFQYECWDPKPYENWVPTKLQRQFWDNKTIYLNKFCENEELTTLIDIEARPMRADSTISIQYLVIWEQTGNVFIHCADY